MSDCIFCKIIAKEVPSYAVWENGRFLAFLNIRPVNPGHILIVPKQHIDNLFELPDGLYEELFAIAKALSAPLRKTMDSARIGAVIEGFGVPHAHLHLVPIDHPHELDSTRESSPAAEELAAIAEKLSAAFKTIEAKK